MSEPVFRLGESRAAGRERLPFWQRLKKWFRGRNTPPLGRLPRPPRSVLLRQTLAEDVRKSSERR